MQPTKNRFLLWFDARLHALTQWYEALVPRLVARRKVVLIVFVLALVLLGVLVQALRRKALFRPKIRVCFTFS